MATLSALCSRTHNKQLKRVMCAHNTINHKMQTTTATQNNTNTYIPSTSPHSSVPVIFLYVPAGASSYPINLVSLMQHFHNIIAEHAVVCSGSRCPILSVHYAVSPHVALFTLTNGCSPKSMELIGSSSLVVSGPHEERSGQPACQVDQYVLWRRQD